MRNALQLSIGPCPKPVQFHRALRCLALPVQHLQVPGRLVGQRLAADFGRAVLLPGKRVWHKLGALIRSRSRLIKRGSISGCKRSWLSSVLETDKGQSSFREKQSRDMLQNKRASQRTGLYLLRNFSVLIIILSLQPFWKYLNRKTLKSRKASTRPRLSYGNQSLFSLI